jgi:hypothetical protein
VKEEFMKCSSRANHQTHLAGAKYKLACLV